MKQQGFSFVEVLVSLFLTLTALLSMEFMNMTALNLIAKGKINQRATLLLLQKVEELRTAPIETLTEGDFQESAGIFSIRWQIKNHSPYFGSRQIQCGVRYEPAASVIVESIFYRSE